MFPMNSICGGLSIAKEILLLPYNPKRYALHQFWSLCPSRSGLVSSPWSPTAPEMAGMLKDGWGAGTIFPEATEEAVTAALLDAIDRRAALLAQAKRTAAAWRNLNTTEVLLDQLLKAVA